MVGCMTTLDTTDPIPFDLVHAGPGNLQERAVAGTVRGRVGEDRLPGWRRRT